MDYIFDKFTEWIKNLLVDGIMNNLSGLFDNVNAKVSEISTQIGSTPQAWNGNIFNMIKNLSDNVILPIAGVILALVMTLELIQLITDRNNLHDVDTWMFFKWIFKTACAVLVVSHTWDLVMGVFDVAQNVISRSAGIINGTLNIDIASHFTDLETRLQQRMIRFRLMNRMQISPSSTETQKKFKQKVSHLRYVRIMALKPMRTASDILLRGAMARSCRN